LDLKLSKNSLNHLLMLTSCLDHPHFIWKTTHHMTSMLSDIGGIFKPLYYADSGFDAAVYGKESPHA
jgi:hypothetical protein